MDEEVTFIGRFRIDNVEAWTAAIGAMAEAVRHGVPTIRSFHAFLSDDGTEGTVVYVHPDADSLDRHLAALADRIDAGSAMVEVTGIELLGAPNPSTVDRLRADGTPVVVRRFVSGFRRASAGDD